MHKLFLILLKGLNLFYYIYKKEITGLLIPKNFIKKVRTSPEVIKLLYYFNTKFKAFNNKINTIMEVKDKLAAISKKEAEGFKTYVIIFENFKA